MPGRMVRLAQRASGSLVDRLRAVLTRAATRPSARRTRIALERRIRALPVVGRLAGPLLGGRRISSVETAPAAPGATVALRDRPAESEAPALPAPVDEGSADAQARRTGRVDPDSNAPPRSAPAEAKPVAGLPAMVGALVERLTKWPPIRRLLQVLDGAGAAGGGLLAAGLAFHAMFAFLPALVLLTGLVGFVIDDPVRRADLIRDVVAQVPPLEPIVRNSLEGVVTGRGIFAIVGLLGLLWGASSFYGSLDDGMRRLFPGGTQRGEIERRIRGVVTVVGLVATAVASVLVGGFWSLLEGLVGGADLLPIVRLGAPTVTIAIFTLVTLLCFRLVPTSPPGWRAAAIPALFTGITVGLLTNLFTLIAPRLIGGLSAFGAFVAIFAALIWLNYVFQFLIWGGAWARLRRDDDLRHRRISPP